MKNKIKTLSVIACALVLAFALAGCGSQSSGSGSALGSSGASGKASAVLGTQDLLGGSAITKGAKYFEEEMGIDTSAINRFDAGRDIITALTSGSADFGGPFGVVPTVVGLTSGTDFKVIYIECLIRGSEGLVVREGSGIKSVAEAMKAGIDTRKWICVEANELMVTGYGDVVMLIMLNTEGGMSAQSFVDAFSKVVGAEPSFTI